MMQRLAPALAALEDAVTDARTASAPAGRLRSMCRASLRSLSGAAAGRIYTSYPNIELDIVTDDALVDIVSSGLTPEFVSVKAPSGYGCRQAGRRRQVKSSPLALSGASAAAEKPPDLLHTPV